jgi:simple sugar transport system permease protein
MKMLSKRNGYYLVAILATSFFYFNGADVTTSVYATGTVFALPLALAAMVGIMCERTGIVNIGIEGTMLLSAFVAFFVASLTQNIIIGLIAAIFTGSMMGLVLAVMAVSWRMDQIIAGTIINILATGLTSFLYVQGKTIPNVFQSFEIPLLSKIPFFGPVLFIHGALTFLGLAIILALYVAIYHTTWGLRSRAVGEHPSSADTAGVSVARLRYINVTIAGAVGAIAGAYLALELVGSFERGFIAGKGFTALALMIFGRWNPLGALAAAMFFGLAQAYANQLMIDQIVNIPSQFTAALPYVMTIVVLTISAGKVRPPAAEGQPYEKGQA